MENRFLKRVCVFLIVSIVILLASLFIINENKLNHLDSIEFEYYEDPTGEMDLEKIQKEYLSEMFLSNEKDVFCFGKSSSTYWIRIPLKEIDNHYYKDYLSIYGPTVTKAILYLPIEQNENLVYKKLSSGWYFGEDKDDEGFFYPVFRWDENADFERDAYIQLYSKFTQNYRINFLSLEEFEQIKRNNYMLNGILFGILLSVVIHNFIIFIELKDKAHIYYIFYIMLMLIYQGNLLGIYNVFIPVYSNVIMSNTITISLMVMSAVIMFFRAFFKTKENFPMYDKILTYIVLIVLGDIFLIKKQPVLANTYAHSISILASVFMIFLAFKAHKKGLKQAKLFIIGWSIMIISLGISFIRHLGGIPNNSMTVNIIFIAVAIKSILLSTALVKRVKSLTEEKEKAIKQCEEAEENAQSHEIAFLHAQIKPHFLYNTLNIIIILCRIDVEKARDLLLDLASFLRHTFDFHEDQKLISLKDELEYVQAYVRIEQARFRDKVNVIYELDETIQLRIPPLILQPLVENAIIHGIRRKNGVGNISLKLKEEKNHFRIEVEDDGSGMTKEQINHAFSDKWSKGRGIGLTNINKRLEKIYGQGLKIESSPDKGTKVSLIIRKDLSTYDKSGFNRR